jgi:hypothetical protein
MCCVFLVFAACATGVKKVRFDSMLGRQLAPKEVTQVEIFHTQKPARHYKELGVLTYRAGTGEPYTDVARFFREKAASIGADGVIMMGTKVGPSVPLGGIIATLNDYSAMAICYEASE